MRKLSNPKVMIAVPNTGWIRQELTEAIVEWVCNPQECLLLIDLPVGGTGPDDARNKIVRNFLESESEFLLMIDSDNPPTKNPLTLVFEDRDIVCMPTPIFRHEGWRFGCEPLIWNIFDDHWDGNWRWRQSSSAPREVIEAGGTGAILIARRVLEHPAMRWPFRRNYDEDGLWDQGSDLLFCRRAREAGFQISVSWEHTCQHFKEVDLLTWKNLGNMRDIKHAGAPQINTEEYWNEEWRKREGSQTSPEVMAEILRRVRDNVLDFGCGNGELLDLLKFHKVECEGVEMSGEAVKRARERGLEVHHRDTIPDGEWGTIVMSQVLEHVDDDRGLIEEAFRHTRHLVISVPDNCLPPGLEPEHRRVYTLQSLRHLFPDDVKVDISYVQHFAIVEAWREGPPWVPEVEEAG